MSRRAFTLTELLIAAAILGVLLAFLAPAIHRIRESSHRLQCQNNLKQIGVALHAYHDAYDRFPSAMLNDPQYYPKTQGKPSPEMPWLSWRGYLLPYLSQ